MVRFRKSVTIGIMCMLKVVVTLSVGNDDRRMFFVQEKLIPPKDLPPSKPEVLDVAMILLNVNTNRTEQVG